MARKQAAQKDKLKHNCDVIVAGGGPTGLLMAARAGTMGLKVVVIERADMDVLATTQHDGRTTALAYGSKLIFDESGVWDSIADACGAIRDIHVADQHAPMTLDFESAALGGEAFGYIVENSTMRHALGKRARELDTIDILSPATIGKVSQDKDSITVTLDDGRTVTGKLLVAADGRQSFCREQAGIKGRQWSYGETALIFNINHSEDHNGLALERFFPGGPFAVLPMKGKKSSIVWTEKPERAEALASMDENDFIPLLKERGCDYVGDITLASPRQLYPLQFMLADKLTDGRMVLIGEAAHAMHPVAGQGYNLSVRDIGVLGDLLESAVHDGRDIGSAALLEKFENTRAFDHFAFMTATDILVKLFSNNFPPVRWARQFGLGIVSKLPPAKNFFSRMAMGLLT